MAEWTGRGLVGYMKYRQDSIRAQFWICLNDLLTGLDPSLERESGSLEGSVQRSRQHTKFDTHVGHRDALVQQAVGNDES